MWGKWMALASVALSSAVLASACGPAYEPDEEAAEVESFDVNDLDEAELAILPRCGGIAGTPCRVGERCVDLRGDGCDPARGGADCLGVCVAPPPRSRICDPQVRYVARSPERCAAIRFFCEDGEPVFDRCGCGCRIERGRGPGVRCGDNFCTRGDYCCNESCGICAPRGGACIQIACE
jgi:hypothetical protein